MKKKDVVFLASRDGENKERSAEEDDTETGTPRPTDYGLFGQRFRTLIKMHDSTFI